MSQTADKLQPLRQQIDTIDGQLLSLLAQRQAVVQEVAVVKRETGMEVHQPGRYDQLLAHLVSVGAELDVSADLIRAIWDAIHTESMRSQQEVLNNSQL